MRVEISPRDDKKHILIRRILRALGVLGVMLVTEACPTDTIFRRRPSPPAAPAPRPAPPLENSSSRPNSSPPPSPQARAPVEPGPTIREEELRDKRPAPPPKPPQEPPARALPPPPSALPPPPPPAPPPPAAAALDDDSSLLAKITPTTTPQRAASLRLTEEGRKLLGAGDPVKALGRLEKTIAVDSTNPYGYYFLAKAHYYLGRHQESLKFLDVAESLFARDSYWLAEVFALRGEDFRALGAADRADTSYAQALRLNPGNRLAAEGLSRLQGEPRETR
jgi:hypothetical protein